jgi:predicted glycogen debranching enzyme
MKETTMADVRWPRRTLTFPDTPSGAIDPTLEWLVTNGLGGFASGPVSGGLTRRYHGMLVAAQPPPLGRMVFVSALRTWLCLGDARVLIDHEDLGALAAVDGRPLHEFGLDGGLPRWRYEVGSVIVEKRVVMPHRRNTTCVIFKLLAADQPVRIECEPVLNVRPLESPLVEGSVPPLSAEVSADGVTVVVDNHLPRLRFFAQAGSVEWEVSARDATRVEFAEEVARGYHHVSELYASCRARLTFADGTAAMLLTTEADHQADVPVQEWLEQERQRRLTLLALPDTVADDFEAELTLAADQFVIAPVGHAPAASAVRTTGAYSRSVIAGYHWFTDWGRDTMISLDGLTLVSGRHAEAAEILRMFAGHVVDGLIPNLFPEGHRTGLYHTADATLWFFEAIHRYTERTRDQSVLADLLPTLVEILRCHRRGTLFGIGVDATDQLLVQGEPGYALTWMDAKMDGWVVTPRRGKAVEINALWYNALQLMAGWHEARGDQAEAAARRHEASLMRASFNARFWNPDTGHLFDVVDGEGGNDPACRPNQLFSMSLSHPVLDEERWPAVVSVVREKLLTPLGLRTLAPDEPGYQSQYTGALRSRDGAYHQGTVWPWLIGAYVDALLKVAPGDVAAGRAVLAQFPAHLSQAGVGSISEICDADGPHRPRGCIAQAWSVAEVLRAWRRTRPPMPGE